MPTNDLRSTRVCGRGLPSLRDQLLATGAQWPGSRATFANDVYHSEFPSVYRTPNRPWRQASWRTALSGETLDHFSAERVQPIFRVFTTLSTN